MLPAAARRFRVADARLAAALRGGGAELVCVSPDVEIVSRIEELRGGAPVAVVSLGHPGWTRGSLPARIAKRSAASARVRAEAVLAGRALRRLGYPLTEIVTWDVGHAFRGAGNGAPRSAVEYMPQCALVFGRREAAGQSLADSALEAAGVAVDAAPAVGARGADARVHRSAAGPGGGGAGAPPDSVAARCTRGPSGRRRARNPEPPGALAECVGQVGDRRLVGRAASAGSVSAAAPCGRAAG